MSKKTTGSYYTPKILSDFLTKHITHNYLASGDISILEPSCGDGQFVTSLFHSLGNRGLNLSIDLVDTNKKELSNAYNSVPELYRNASKSYCQDYLEYFLSAKKKYSLIIGNPPYIKKENLTKPQISKAQLVHERVIEYSPVVQSNGKIKNIWPAFVEAAIMSLENYGILCFVLPSEILQVNYAKELRNLIEQEFDKVEVFAFNELLFEGIQQDVIALIGVKGVVNPESHGFSFYQVNKLKDLQEPTYTLLHSNIHRTCLDKWTNYILSDEELNFVSECKQQYNPIISYTINAQVGIVTAANDYFIVNDDILKLNRLTRFKNIIKPILSKGESVPNTLSFSIKDFQKLKSSNKAINFLHFPNKPKYRFGKIINNYFNEGERIKPNRRGELHKRYKMTKRYNWYHVPSVWSSQGLFIKRSHLYPRMFENAANVLATDSFYRVNVAENYCIRNLVFSFYNSLTFVLAELEGRFYGGGVLELIPNEFKNLVIPYKLDIGVEEFEQLDLMLRENMDITEILTFTNSILIPDLNTKKLEELRQKLVNRRIKTDMNITKAALGPAESINSISTNGTEAKIKLAASLNSYV